MKKENLALLAEGHKLIALAYAREAGADLTLDTEETVVAETPVVDEQAQTKKPGKIVPKVTKEEEPVEEEEVEVEADEDEEEGYSLDELNAMTVKQLKELASEHGIHIPKDTKKADIIDIIMEGATEEDAETDEEDAEDVQTDEDDVEATETEEADTEDEDEEYEELTIADVEAMEDAELKDLAKEYEVDLPKKFDREKAIEAIVKALFEEDEIEAHYGQEADEEAPEEDEEGDEDYLTEADLEEMSLTELKELAKEYEIEHPKVIKADKLRAILVEALFAEEEEEEDEESDETDLDNGDLAEEYGLNEMSVEELQELLTDHKIKAKGNKQALIAKVLEAIEEGVIEVDEEEGE